MDSMDIAANMRNLSRLEQDDASLNLSAFDLCEMARRAAPYVHENYNAYVYDKTTK